MIIGFTFIVSRFRYNPLCSITPFRNIFHRMPHPSCASVELINRSCLSNASARRDNLANITITCTDNIKSRIDLWNLLRALPQPTYCTYETPLYWMDFGNTQTTGQVVLGTVPKKIKQPASKLYETVNSLKVITRMVKYTRVKETDSGPSCSLAEALEKQDLLINSTLAQLGCGILWKMFRNGVIEHNGLYLNLDTMKVNSIII